MKRLFFAIAILPWILFACQGAHQRAANYTSSETVAADAVLPEKTAPAEISMNTEGYAAIVENEFRSTVQHPLSTFSVDVDKAAYSNVRRFLNEGRRPPAGAVRIEEMINYFDYDYELPRNKDAFNVITEIAECPWNTQHRLVHIGIRGKEIPRGSLPPSNLVFLVDVSGSMLDEDKLPLLKRSMLLLTDNLRPEDRVAIVAYAGNAGLVLPSTGGENKSAIREAITGLEAGGATAGGAGIQLAYEVAEKNFITNGNNRVLLATDGDFNVGASSDDALVQLIEEKRKTGIFLSILGFGRGNYQDNKMQQLADKGNGNHSYIDDISEAQKVLVNEFGGTLFTIAKDVKIQVEFNAGRVQAYRLIGYENRVLNKEDFNDDGKDAGEIGSGHTVTALYEVIPVGIKNEFEKPVDELKYQRPAGTTTSDELFTLKLRYKNPEADHSQLITVPVADRSIAINKTTDNFRFAAAVAEFGLLLRNSAFRQQSNYEQVLELAKGAMGIDKNGYREAFISLVRKGAALPETGIASAD
ncbi:vWA domain-containing protein [Niabella drilacis]|uniref:Ca-activated chloride channel family protein n=1 Tax=Niabella drilacis (strain DSM 25811 / CCM 8410 / CCUG 62505 / LMG 26954 / E90) TaxID=1285928 RepID=A0A1G6WV47_NIADE|nr:VWA domain-containing protein [Niabella drilacis]SDD69762.1 Ca-activated chloride channel family protein [Niabella drilacis]